MGFGGVDLGFGCVVMVEGWAASGRPPVADEVESSGAVVRPQDVYRAVWCRTVLVRPRSAALHLGDLHWPIWITCSQPNLWVAFRRAPLAQWIAHQTSNLGVAGSSTHDAFPHLSSTSR